MKATAFSDLLKRIQQLPRNERSAVRAFLAAEELKAGPMALVEPRPAECPKCGSQQSVRYGRVRGQQRWRCSQCKRTFGAHAGSPMMGLRHKSAWAGFTHAISNGASAIEVAEQCGIHRNTAFRWRRRLLASSGKPSMRASRAALQRRDSLPSAPEARIRTSQRTERSRQALSKGLLAVMGRKQFDQVTIRELTVAANVGYATFFRHYASKQELLNEIAAEQMRRLLEVCLPLVENHSLNDPRSASLALCEYVYERRALWTLLLNGGAAAALRRESIRLSADYGKLRNSDWLPIELGAIHGVSSVIEILAWWLQRPDKYGPEKIAQIMDRLVVMPLMAGSSVRRR